ncbi:SWI5/SAE3 family protein [Aspergillus clavatus NRRL 1]|uniref:DUF1337 domain protein n=1 Tax=Aspergillus clavatus (strain ATCC 1007 / CBS 513.65 / DSM 816 / NCTC 3887 / NRRL 1 / QM 1276 / 107) TaxID=344612 RepID=A1C9U9_ASPCL|nr:DUF1337 domain protein [Aspergillus clavatus NRRL 1]EAW12517.1 DUF1337 domain protein [Aspergillus clavatus NRRL 1]
MPFPSTQSPPQSPTENSQPPDVSHLSPEQQVQRDKKIKALQASIADIQSQTAQLEAQIAETKAKLKNDPSMTVKHHIRLLHEYNEIKDVGQGLLGLIADARGMRQIDVQREFGLGDRD